MPTPAAVLFDLDNTAYAYDPAHRGGLHAAFDVAKGIHARLATFDSFVAEYDAARREVKPHVAHRAAEHCRFLYFKRLIERLTGRTQSAPTVALHDAYWAGYHAAMRRDDGCAEVLASLRDHGVPTAFVTNFTTERQFRKLQTLGLADAVDLIVTSEEAGAEKPDPAIVVLAMHRMNVVASPAVVLVGDSVTDDGGVAAATGISFVWMRRGGSDKPNSAVAIADDWAGIGRLLG
jgi:putative hydrolase of the HAD superfamily